MSALKNYVHDLLSGSSTFSGGHFLYKIPVYYIYFKKQYFYPFFYKKMSAIIF